MIIILAMSFAMRWITVQPQEEKAKLAAEKQRKRKAMSEELRRKYE